MHGAAKENFIEKKMQDLKKSANFTEKVQILQKKCKFKEKVYKITKHSVFMLH